MTIDADNYVILVRTDSHPAERKTVLRDVAVGLSMARTISRQLRAKFPQRIVQIFHCPTGGAMHLIEGTP